MIMKHLKLRGKIDFRVVEYSPKDIYKGEIFYDRHRDFDTDLYGNTKELIRKNAPDRKRRTLYLRGKIFSIYMEEIFKAIAEEHKVFKFPFPGYGVLFIAKIRNWYGYRGRSKFEWYRHYHGLHVVMPFFNFGVNGFLNSGYVRYYCYLRRKYKAILYNKFENEGHNYKWIEDEKIYKLRTKPKVH